MNVMDAGQQRFVREVLDQRNTEVGSKTLVKETDRWKRRGAVTYHVYTFLGTSNVPDITFTTFNLEKARERFDVAAGESEPMNGQELTECKFCGAVINLAFAVGPPAWHSPAAGTKDDPCPPGDQNDECAACCYGAREFDARGRYDGE